LDPKPGAWTELAGREVKLFGGHGEVGGGAPGEVLLTDGGVRVVTGDGVVVLDEVQPAGKARMSAAAWGRGRGVRAGERLV
ncbi:MAG TPA: hypothetical protein VH116_06645, partial [Gemmatimonadales bacterium]|nr:hypothetical protein [Gemmatimonadales bacterium]